MKKISLIITLVICSQLLVAQNFVSKHISNKLTLDYELNWGVVLDADYIGDGVIGNLKGTKYFNTFNVSYKVASRISVSLGYGFHKQKGENSFYNWVNFNEDAEFTGNELQIAVNLFGRQQRAPLGNHFTIFYNKQSIFSDGLDYQNTSGDDFKLDLTSIGIGYNFVWIMNKKLPIYLKYGLSLSAPIVSNIEYPNYTGVIRVYTLEDIVDSYQYRNILRANIGIGYAF